MPRERGRDLNGPFLVCGGGGFAGMRLVSRLADAGLRARILDLRRPPAALPAGAEYLQADVCDARALDRAMEGAAGAYNFVSLLPCARAGGAYLRVNVEGTRRILEAAARAGVRRVVHVSSSVVYGIPRRVPIREDDAVAPCGDYGRSKLEAERVCASFAGRIEIPVLRPRFIVGPGRLGLLTILFSWIREGRRIYLIGDGANRFQMLGVDDLAEACVLAMERGRSVPYNLGAAEVPSVRGLIEELIRHAGSRSRTVGLPAGLARGALRLLDLLRLTPLGTEHYWLADREYVLDCSRARSDLGWEPRQAMAASLCAAYDRWLAQQGAGGGGRSEMPHDAPAPMLLDWLRRIS